MNTVATAFVVDRTHSDDVLPLINTVGLSATAACRHTANTIDDTNDRWASGYVRRALVSLSLSP